MKEQERHRRQSRRDDDDNDDNDDDDDKGEAEKQTSHQIKAERRMPRSSWKDQFLFSFLFSLLHSHTVNHFLIHSSFGYLQFDMWMLQHGEASARNRCIEGQEIDARDEDREIITNQLTNDAWSMRRMNKTQGRSSECRRIESIEMNVKQCCIQDLHHS